MAQLFSDNDILEYMSQIEASGVLGRSKRRKRLLEHLLRSEQEGAGERLKAYSIGLDIFGKPEQFDPSTDSVVRVEMGRLRAAIALFEASDFSETRIEVNIPLGTYRPVVSLRTPPTASPAQSTPTPVLQAPPKTNNRWWLALGALLAVLTIVLSVWYQLVEQTRPSEATLTVALPQSDHETAHGQAVRSLLAQSLSRSDTIRVVDNMEEAIATRSATTFLLSLQMFEDTHGFRTLVELRDADTTRVIWGKSFFSSDMQEQLDLAETRIARELRVRLFGASKSVLETMALEDMSPEALFVLSTWVPGPAQSSIDWEEERIHLARLALEKDPNFGAAHSVLADKLAYLSNVYGPADTAENRQAAEYHARRAMELSPLDPDVVFNVAQSHWHSGRIAESHATMRRVIELDSSHDLARFLHLVVPYTCETAPDSVVEAAIAFDAALSPDNPIRWLTLTWTGWLHSYRQEWEKALAVEEQAALIFQIPYTFMRRAMVLNKLGRPEDAAQVIEQHDISWSKFSSSYYVDNTIPRLCSENPKPELFIEPYIALKEALGKY
ncbi:tetratricopeptide repeat protein [Epibacterium ulvae]|uniref:tetratricopeptide repeat protein n=1 Tax=Epibacterium ulvae TaxID=1156985 RepID=UPI002492ED83|nr:hypothetical protein [Epibacterium ulvae]